MITTDLLIDVKPFNETFNPIEAKQLVKEVIDKKINSYKIEYLSHWEKNHHIESDRLDRLITALKIQKQDLIDQINEANIDGRKVKLNCSLELSFE